MKVLLILWIITLTIQATSGKKIKEVKLNRETERLDSIYFINYHFFIAKTDLLTGKKSNREWTKEQIKNKLKAK